MDYKEAEELSWEWNGKKVPLYKLHDKQLEHIIGFISKSKQSKYSDISAKDWVKACNMVLKGRKVFLSIVRNFKDFNKYDTDTLIRK